MSDRKKTKPCCEKLKAIAAVVTLPIWFPVCLVVIVPVTIVAALVIGEPFGVNIYGDPEEEYGRRGR